MTTLNSTKARVSHFIKFFLITFFLGWNTPSHAAVTIDNINSVVDSSGVGGGTAILIGSDGFPVIAYRDNVNADLKVAKCGNSSCTAGNILSVVDSAGEVGNQPAIALGADSYPVISYWDQTNGFLKVAKCGNATCNGGNVITTVDGRATTGQYGSIAVGNDGLPVISYQDVTGQNLMVAKCGNASCSSGNTLNAVDVTGDVGQYTSMAFGLDGFPVIAYRDGTNSALKLLKCGNASCSSNNIISVVDTSVNIQHTSIVVGADGYPIISYRDNNTQGLKVVRCGTVACSAGNTVTAVDSQGDVGHYNSMEIGVDGLPVISYRQSDTQDLKVVKCGNSACSNGNQFSVVDSEGFVGADTSIAIGPDGKPVISHFDNTSDNGHLKVAKCATTNCSPFYGKGLAYIINQGSNTAPQGTVSVIDDETSTLLATLAVGEKPTRGVATPDGTKVYVSNWGSGTVSVIDTQAQAVSATVPVGNAPSYMAITPNGKQVYVANVYDNTVSVIDSLTDTVTTTVTVGNQPWFLTATPDGKYIYVGHTGSTYVSVIDTSTNTRLGNVIIGTGSRFLATAPDSSKVYVSQTDLNSVAIIDTKTRQIMGAVPAGYRTGGVAATPDGAQVFAANPSTIADNKATVTAIDPVSMTQTASINVGALTWQIVISEDGRTAYTASSTTELIYAIDTLNKSVSSVIRVGRAPYWSTIGSPGGKLYVTNPPDSSVSIVNTAGPLSVLKTIVTGINPWMTVYANAPLDADDDKIMDNVDNCGTAFNPDQLDSDGDSIGDVCDSSPLPPPSITSISPVTIKRGTTVAFTVTGSGFLPGITASLLPLPAGVSISSVSYSTSSQITIIAVAASDAREGPRDVKVTNPDNISATLPMAFLVVR